MLNLWLAQAASLAEQDVVYLRQLYQDEFYSFVQLEADGFLQQHPQSVFLNEVRLIVAAASLNAGKTKQARGYLQQLLSAEPSADYAEQAHFLLAESNVLDTNNSQSLQAIKQFEHNYPTSQFKPQIKYLKAKISFDQQQYIQSLTFLLDIQQTLPPSKQLNAQWMLGWSYHFLDQKHWAETYFLDLLKQPKIKLSQKIAIQLELVGYAKQQQNLNQAGGRIADILKYPWSAEIAGSQFSAVKDLFFMFQDHPAWAKNNLDLQQTAISWYTQNLNQPAVYQRSASLYQRAWLYVWQNQLQLAQQDLEQQTSHTMRSALLLHWLYQQLGQKQQAQQILAKATHNPNNPKNKDAQNLAEVQVQFAYLAQQRLACDEAEQHAKLIKLAKFKQQRTQANLYLADCLFEKEQYKQAIKYYAQAELNKEMLPFLLRYWQSLAALGRHEIALSSIQTIKNQAWSVDDEALLTLRQIEHYKKIKDWDAVVLNINQLLHYSPRYKNDAFWYILLAENYVQAEDYPAAEQNYQFALNLLGRNYPQFFKIRQELAQVYVQAKQYEKLAQYYTDNLPNIKEPQQKNKIRLYLANLWYSQLQVSDKSVYWLGQLEQPDSSTLYQSQLLTAEINIKKQHYDVAITTLQQLIQDTENTEDKTWFASAQFRLAEVYHLQEAWKKALFHYKKTVSGGIKDSKIVKLAKQRSQKIARYLNDR